MPIADLWSQWDRFYPRRPANPNRSFLESRIAYRIQEEAYGGLSADTQRRLILIRFQRDRCYPVEACQGLHFEGIQFKRQ
jgi:hypothetical protein